MFYKRNHFIKHNKLLVLDQDNEKIGILSKNEALEKAKGLGLDLILISEKGDLPVSKIVDFGKFKYEMSKKKKSQSKLKPENKEIRLTSKIETHDFNVKIKRTRDFILKGSRVKVSLRFRGREMQNKDKGIKVLTEFIESVKDISDLVKEPYMRGMFYEVLLSPNKKTTSKLKEKEKGNKLNK